MPKVKRKPVLVTGGAGCIGLQVCKQLIEDDVPVRLFDLGEQIVRVRSAIPDGVKFFYGSILDSSSIREAMDGCGSVIHLAALLGVKRTETNRLRCLEINIEGTKKLLDCATQHGVKRFVFASSSEVYGEPLKNPVTEDAMTQGKSVYAISKLSGEELCKGYAQRFPGFLPIILRLFNTYGPYQAAQFVLPRFILNAARGKPLTINGRGDQLRSYCYVGDIACGIVKALSARLASGETINLGNGNACISIEALAKLIISLLGKHDVKIQYRRDFEKADRDREREVHKRYCSTEKARKLLGYVPKVSLEEGIRRIAESASIFEKWESTESPYLVDEMT